MTDAGRELAEATSISFSHLEATLDALRASENTLTVSTTPAFAALWLAPRIASFEAGNRAITLRMISSTELTDLRRDRSIDIAIRYSAESDDTRGAVQVSSERFQAFGSRDYIDQLSDLSKAQLIGTQWMSKTLEPVTWQGWCKAAGEHAIPKTRIREFRHEYEVLQAGLSGQGLVLLSNVLAQDMVHRSWLVPYRPEIQLPGFAYWAHVSEQKKPTKKVKHFLSWLQQEMKLAL